MTAPFNFTFVYNDALPNLLFTEIMYHDPVNDSLEFLEIYNADNITVAMGGLVVNEGLDITFPQVNLNPGQTILIAADSSAASNFTVFLFMNGRAHSATAVEILAIRNSLGQMIDSLEYDDAAPCH